MLCSYSYMEVPGARSDPYLSFATKAAKLLKVQPKKGEELKLLKLSGVLLGIERIDVSGLSKD